MSKMTIGDVDARFRQSAFLTKCTGEHLCENLLSAAGRIAWAIKDGRTLFTFGNGGSASDAQHIVGEFVGRFLRERNGYSAVCLNSDTVVLTAIANDYGYDQVLARQLKALAGSGDVLLMLSTSGNSINLLEGIKAADVRGVFTIALTGPGGGKLKGRVNLLLDVPETQDISTPRIQEVHTVVYHVLCELVEEALAA